MPKLNDGVKVIMPDGKVEFGIVQATYPEGGVLIFNGRQYFHYGVLKDDLKAQGAKLEIIPCPDHLERYKIS